MNIVLVLALVLEFPNFDYENEEDDEDDSRRRSAALCSYGVL